MKLTMDTMGDPHTMVTYQQQGLDILDLDEENVIMLPNIYSKDRMHVSRSHIPMIHDLQQWPNLADVYLPELQAEVGLFIGNNVLNACEQLEVKLGPRGSPYDLVLAGSHGTSLERC